MQLFFIVHIGLVMYMWYHLNKIFATEPLLFVDVVCSSFLAGKLILPAPLRISPVFLLSQVINFSLPEICVGFLLLKKNISVVLSYWKVHKQRSYLLQDTYANSSKIYRLIPGSQNENQSGNKNTIKNSDQKWWERERERICFNYYIT